LKSVANFYSIEINYDIRLCICKFIKYLYKKDKNIIVIDSSAKLKELDRLLWSFEQNSFLPHKIYNDGDMIDTPIILLSIQNLDKLSLFDKYDCIINNYDNALLKIKNGINIYEFVDTNESSKSISRNKFLEYKKNDFTLIHNKYNEQAL
jgi:DNA polymerase-3 subunit chi|tara:strand:+ start:571 stop:1020 length:450 start_codon:yes stop_codon:yes gene_type:complete